MSTKLYNKKPKGYRKKATNCLCTFRTGERAENGKLKTTCKKCGKVDFP